jgi:UDP-glucose 4-epimerase
MLEKPDHVINVIGTRHGEKAFEALLSREEKACAEDLGDYFRVPADQRDLNYEKYIENGNIEVVEYEDYNSHNTTRLDVEGMKKLLLKLEFIRDLTHGIYKSPEV